MNLLNISLWVTRQYLYVGVIALAISVLLPWSVLSYLRFYDILIPNASFQLPVKYDSSPLARRPAIFADASALVDIFRNYNTGTGRHSQLNYNLELTLAAHCEKRFIGDARVVQGSLAWSRETDEPLHKLVSEVEETSSFVVQCDPRVLYSAANWLVPYNLRHWVPPFFTNCERLNLITTRVGTFTDAEMLHLLTEPSKDITRAAPIWYRMDAMLPIDVERSFLNVNVEWVGIRYYLFYYYYLCLVLGVGLFWGVSSAVCFLVSMSVWWLVRRRVKQD